MIEAPKIENPAVANVEAEKVVTTKTTEETAAEPKVSQEKVTLEAEKKANARANKRKKVESKGASDAVLPETKRRRAPVRKSAVKVNFLVYHESSSIIYNPFYLRWIPLLRLMKLKLPQ